MPRLRRARVEHRYIRQHRRDRRFQLQPQREPGAVQEYAAMPINPVVHELGELQFHHPDHIDPLPHVPHNANIPKEHNLMEEVPFELPAPHHLGDMTGMCPHCQARYF